ncbi:hypothetical protein [Noviherbaspirillum sp.]|uniref:hypothetical protein n=1 Tax=Noviherbaspirillum sp. TaxID=1926288 RepID=UPI002D3E87BA|nr:hypothetical protein [Noviherbaspirillum sp.]HZW20625.1 hypothetical protein [Noviherbaspirillum sp.]
MTFTHEKWEELLRHRDEDAVPPDLARIIDIHRPRVTDDVNLDDPEDSTFKEELRDSLDKAGKEIGLW